MDKIERLDIEKDYEEVFALSEYAFQYKLSESEVQQKIEDAKSHIIFGYKEKDNLMAKLHLIPLKCHINGKFFDMGGLSSVASWPEYRRGGLVRNLIMKSLLSMRENNQLVSYLHPFSIPFYRKYGWEQVFSYRMLDISVHCFRTEGKTTGYVRKRNDIKLLDDLYFQFMTSYSGNIIRTKQWWENRVLKNNPFQVVAYNDANESIGYLIYEIKDNVMDVLEAVYINNDAKKLLFEFIGNHDSMIERVKMKTPHQDNLIHYLSDPPTEEVIHHHFMARIVDVGKFLKVYPFEYSGAEMTVILSVKDSFLKENEKDYKITVSKHKIYIEETRDTHNEPIINCTVQMLTLMLIGNQSPVVLMENNMIEGDTEAIMLLSQLLKQPQRNIPFFMDTF